MSVIVSRGHSRPLAEIGFVRDGENSTLLVSASHDRMPQIRNGETGDWIGSFIGHKGAIWSAKVDRVSRQLCLSGGGDFAVRLWSVQDGQCLADISHSHVVKSVDFSPDTLTFTTGCQDGTVRVFDTINHKSPIWELSAMTPEGTKRSNVTKVLNSELQPRHVLVARRDGTLEKYDTRVMGSSAVQQLQVPNFDTTSTVGLVDLEESPPFDTVLTAAGKSVYVLRASDLSVQRELAMPAPLHFRDEGGVSLSPDGKTICVGGSDLWVRQLDSNSGETIRVLKGHHGPVRALRWHPDGRVVATGSEDATIRLWDIDSAPLATE